MDEVGLRVFLSLAETENTRDTAALLRLGQSNVSRALARLERELGVDLFQRRGRRLELNGQGAAFRADAASVLDALDSARRHAAAIASDARIVRIGFLHSVARWLVPVSVQCFREINPEARVSLRQGFSADIYRWMDEDAVDVALCTRPAAPRADVEWRGIARERLCIAVPADHRLAACTSASAADLAGESFVAFSRIAELHAIVAEILAAAGVSVAVVLESSEIDTMRGLVAGGIGVSILPRPVRESDAGPVYVPLEPPRYREIGIAWRSDVTRPEVAQFVAAAQGAEGAPGAHSAG